ncbi:hypothetical protein TSTA_060140 [Talaromyces stipitatus ATCC 10500]|uniref:Uncharacterized protein n=1 Tax=Talaromyces stipitatus (strain ATCC 10500 / CBS 375.48 / QM 6759 / NRRL 1006) TaxID=441959 RepID=B8LU44_TALSN|nr:uncharacterized protein TSTA_060140 [Talaromyces stipitatus ATCC 10500]EED22516.1 hypothetical protein TSTA_060140 [Talaromyces stipitatus ATCC 10500]
MSSSTPVDPEAEEVSGRWTLQQYLCFLGVYLVSEDSGFYYGDSRAVDDLTRRPIENWTPRIGYDTYSSSRGLPSDDKNAWDKACSFLTRRCPLTITKSQLRSQLHYLLDELGRISGDNNIQMIERNRKERLTPSDAGFTDAGNFLGIGMCIGIYVYCTPDYHRRVDYVRLAEILNRCPAFSQMNVTSKQVEYRFDDVWHIIGKETESTLLLPAPLLGKRPSAQDLNSDRTKQSRYA